MHLFMLCSNVHDNGYSRGSVNFTGARTTMRARLYSSQQPFQIEGVIFKHTVNFAFLMPFCFIVSTAIFAGHGTLIFTNSSSRVISRKYFRQKLWHKSVFRSPTTANFVCLFSLVIFFLVSLMCLVLMERTTIYVRGVNVSCVRVCFRRPSCNFWAGVPIYGWIHMCRRCGGVRTMEGRTMSPGGTHTLYFCCRLYRYGTDRYWDDSIQCGML